jgi:hypothetical protein
MKPDADKLAGAYWSSWQPVALSAPEMAHFLLNVCGLAAAAAATGGRDAATGGGAAAGGGGGPDGGPDGAPLQAEAAETRAAEVWRQQFQCMGVMLVGTVAPETAAGYRGARGPAMDKVAWASDVSA